MQDMRPIVLDLANRMGAEVEVNPQLPHILVTAPPGHRWVAMNSLMLCWPMAHTPKQEKIEEGWPMLFEQMLCGLRLADAT